MESEPVFFELSWSILSTIGAGNVFFGILVVSVTNFSPIAAVPLVTSAACAVANGVCFYAYYLPTVPVTNRAVAAAFADILWLIQEAGISLYSYVILSRILRDRQWYLFASLFWTTMVAIVAVRINIAITRVRFIVGGDMALQRTVNYLHMAYFPLLALLECVSAYYLLRTFAQAKMSTFRRTSKTGLFQYLVRSTEVRLALLALVGIMRAVTYSFQVKPQRALNLANQVDRFCYTMECLFPIVIYIDMLSSKIVYRTQQQEQQYNISLDLQLPGSTSRTASNGGKARVEQFVLSGGLIDPGDVGDTGSGEHIVGAEPYRMESSDIGLAVMETRWPGGSRTVDVEAGVNSFGVEPRSIPV
ncbi:hypothetical protein N657DRAFT_405477 [Parathielavia appendiculata]|uniref:Uncharacterized protein n=1 Tax=Parathielavia appendiculata TaxID=2587402 RepID=A0AAN6TPF2_9PEZI|nr:hypothetical protein N657DRAFT_405477 [Parathielavia appendiculata]